MKVLSNEAKEKIFLALTKIHRDIVNDNTVCFYQSFHNVGYTNDNMIRSIKEALHRMKILSYNGSSYIWNSKMTTPNPQLVEGIITTIKQIRDNNKVNTNIKIKPAKTYSLIILINDTISQASRTSITWQL